MSFNSSFFSRIVASIILSTSILCDVTAADWNAIVPNLTSNDLSVIDLSSPFPSVTTIPGTLPFGKSAITPDGKTAYIASGNSSVTGTVTPYDFLTETIGTPINLQLGTDIGKLPGFIAITPNGKTAYVGCITTHDVWVLDLETNTVIDRISAGLNAASSPIGIAVTPDGLNAYVTDGINNVVVIDTTTNTVISSVILPTVTASPVAITITPDGKLALIVCKPLIGTKYVAPISLPDNTVGLPINVDNGPNDITVTADGKTAYVTCQNARTLVPIDLQTLTALPSISLSTSGVGPVGVDITPDDKTALVAFTNGTSNNGIVIPVDTATGSIGTSITVGTNPSAITITPDQAPNAAFLFLVDPCSFDVLFDASSSNSPVGTIQQYDWDFGDGTQVSTDSPLTAHTYETTGNFNVRLTVTNSTGTSTAQVFTGQTMTRNGGPTATITQVVTLALPSIFPPENFRGKQFHNIFGKNGFSFFNILRWNKPDQGEKPVSYEIYRDPTLTDLVAIVSAKAPRLFIDKKLKRGNYPYYIVSISESGTKSCLESTVVEAFSKKHDHCSSSE